MKPPTSHPGRAVLAIALPLALLGTSACSSDFRVAGPAQTVTITAPAMATVKGKQLRLTAVSGGGATIAVSGADRLLREGDAFTVDDVRFTVDRVNDASHSVTLTGKVEFSIP